HGASPSYTQAVPSASMLPLAPPLYALARVYARCTHRDFAPHLRDVVEHALALAPLPHRLRVVLGDGEWTDEISRASLERTVSDVAGWPRNANWVGATSSHDGDEVEIAYAASSTDFPQEAASIAVRFPAAWLVDDEARVTEWFVGLAERIPHASSGTLGLGLVHVSLGRLPLLLTHPALDVSVPSVVRADLRAVTERAAGVAYRTFLSRALWQRSGLGSTQLRTLDLAHGKVVCAGEGALWATDDASAAELHTVAEALHRCDALHVPRTARYGTWALHEADGDYLAQQWAAQERYHLRFASVERWRAFQADAELARQSVGALATGASTDDADAPF
ncbi:MAG: hypothetical protein U0235_07410, partial [Polyangiaceae bacterium]